MPDYTKPDHWALKAQKEGYPARSVYKLKEIEEKFGLIKQGRQIKILDLGAAPGSWSLYILRKFKTLSGLVSLLSIDLSPLSREYDQGLFDNKDFLFIQGDITSPQIRERVLEKAPYQLLVSDAAPATTGNRSVDTVRSLELAETVLDYAETALVKGGNLVVKVFQGGDTGSLLKRIRTQFETGRSFKPQSCRSESFETYFIGLGKK
jgi:23S rRNA (uridine2552-2'-O)-methyltransferase